MTTLLLFPYSLMQDSAIMALFDNVVPKLKFWPILKLGKPNLKFQVWVPILKLGCPNLKLFPCPILKLDKPNLKLLIQKF